MFSLAPCDTFVSSDIQRKNDVTVPKQEYAYPMDFGRAGVMAANASFDEKQMDFTATFYDINMKPIHSITACGLDNTAGTREAVVDMLMVELLKDEDRVCFERRIKKIPSRVQQESARKRGSFMTQIRNALKKSTQPNAVKQYEEAMFEYALRQEQVLMF
jgi:hypothetical protein